MSDAQAPRSPLRRWIPRVLVGLAVVVVLGGVGLFAVTRSLDPVRLAGWLEPRMETALARDVSVGAARVDLFPPVAIALAEVEIANPPGFQGEPLASLGELRLDLSLWELLRRRVAIDEVRILRPEIRVVVTEDGTSNAAGLGVDGHEVEGGTGDGGEPFQVGVESIRVDEGSISYRNESDGSALVVAPLTSRFRLRSADGDRWTLDGTAEARLGARTGGVDGTRIGPYDVSLEAEGEAHDAFSTVGLTRASVLLEELAFDLTAEVQRDDTGRGTLTAHLQAGDLDAARLLSLVPDSLRSGAPELAGRLGTDLRYAMEIGTAGPPRLDGQLVIDEGSAALDGKDPLISRMAGNVYVTLDSAWTTDLEAQVAGGPVRVRGLVRTGEASGFVARVAAQPDLGRVGALVTLPDSVSLSGGLTVDVTARGLLEDPAGVSLSGRVEPEDVRMSLPGIGVPVSLPQGTVLLDGDAVRWRDLPVLLGSDRFVTTGELDHAMTWARGGGAVPMLDGSFSGDRLDLDAVFPSPPPDSVVLYGRLLFARLGERRVRDRTPREILEDRGLIRPDSIPLAGNLRVAFGTLLSAPHELSDVRARIQFRPNLIQVRDVEGGAYGGTIQAHADVGLGGGADQPFSFRMEARDVRAGDFLSATSPLGQVFDGTLSLDLDVSGDMDDVYLPTPTSLLGSGAFTLRDGVLHAGALTDALSGFFSIPEIRDLRLEDWYAPLLLREGRVVLQESGIRGAIGEPTVAGSVGFGGQLALNLLFRLPTERLDSAALARTGIGPDVLRRVRSGGAPLDAALRVAGTVVEPLLSADPASVTQGIADAVQEEVEAQIQEELQERRNELEDRAIEAVDRLLPPTDTTRPGLPGINDLRRLISPGRTGASRDTTAASPDTTARPDPTTADSVAAPRDTVPPPPPDTVRRDTVPDTVGVGQLPAGRR